ncbi:hypothetical protein DB88DRAFT_522051 [Papiliotrema laurentii]|uniref:Uncharacterized protein n=1 Tax=Papiliotrema laurentii TaxID=5418 RepID=A0AAD9FUY2_PAPLA|nr:hypothetical protein DB88DRAFT_522051 [Papiliotrema laurentii]
MQTDYISGYSARGTASGCGGRVTLSEATTVERRSGNQVFYTFKTSGSGVEVKCPIPSLAGENWMQAAQRGYTAAHFAEELRSRLHSSPQTENDAKAWMSHYFNSDPYEIPDSFYQPIAEPCASRMGKYLRANRSWAFTGEELYFDHWGRAGESHTIKYRVNTSQPKLSKLVEHESERLKAALRAQLGDEPRRDVSYFDDYWKIVRSLCHTFGSQATYYPHSFPDKDRSRRVISYQEDRERGTSPSADEIHAGLVAYVQSRERRGEQPHNQPPPLPPPPVGMRHLVSGRIPATILSDPAAGWPQLSAPVSSTCPVSAR